MNTGTGAAPLRIGLTGGIASGKSAVATLFAGHGVAVIDTDVIAHELTGPGQPALAQLTQAFGPGILAPDGSLDRAALRSQVFEKPSERQRLEGILHPLIAAEMLARAARAPGPYQVLVIPLLVETGMQTLVDRVLVVDCPEELQVERLRARDGGSVADARRILAAQATREQRRAIADDVIVNDGELGDLRRAVSALHEKYSVLASVCRRPPAL